MIKKISFFQSSTNSLKFILFYNFFNFVITDTFKARRFIFIRNLILSCSFSRLFKSRRIKEHSKTRSHRFEWLWIYFIRYYIDSQSFDEIINHWVCVFFDDEKYYQCMIDSQLLFINLIIDSLLWSFERLSSFDFENNLFFKFMEFMINLSDDHFEHLCLSKSLIVFSKSLMNILKKVNHSNL